ncbi:hypothetical protein [Dyadobacter linearis]|uniref:hypothetical protein n=1 Tax=Dyadobacter linearis TaxID=2823330 RepID=UPI001BFC052B|nr:hypothetical protein [Dyadobacter sp. CECT 9623]
MNTSLLIILSIIGIAASMRDSHILNQPRQQQPGPVGSWERKLEDGGSGFGIQNEMTNSYLSAK